VTTTLTACNELAAAAVGRHSVSVSDGDDDDDDDDALALTAASAVDSARPSSASADCGSLSAAAAFTVPP